MTDLLRGLVRIDFESGQLTLLLKERPEDLDVVNPKVTFVVNGRGLVITRRALYKNAPVLVYDHHLHGVLLRKSVAMLPGTRFVCLSQDLDLCFGLVQDHEGRPTSGRVWSAGGEGGGGVERLPVVLPLVLDSSRARHLDAAVSNNVVAALFGDMFRPSQLVLFDARSGKELYRIVADLGERPYQILRFTGLTVCLVHKDGALTKIRVVGRRREKEETSGCSVQ